MLRLTLCCTTAVLLALSASAQVDEVRESDFDRRASTETKSTLSIDDAFKPVEARSIDGEIQRAEVPEGREALEKDAFDPRAEMIDNPEDEPLPLPEMTAELEKMELANAGDFTPPERVPEPSRDPKIAFVQTAWLEGLPLAEAQKFANAGDPYFRRVLADPAMLDYHSNVLGILGMSGSPDAEKIILEYIVNGSGRVSDGSFSARTDGILALGYLANTSEGRAGLEVLMQTARPEGWSSMGIEWGMSSTVDRGSQMEMLRASSLIGLALSGRREAEESFAEARRSLGSSRSPAAVTGADLEDFMRAYEEVRSKGLIAYSANDER